MIIRQDSCGTWTVTSGQVLQYGSTQELEIVLQDKDGRNLDPSQHGDIWALSLWTPSASDPVELAHCYLGVDSAHLAGELSLSSEVLYLYCAERFRSIVVLNLRSVPDPDVDAAFELDTRALVQWQGDNHRVCPKPPCPCPPPQPSGDVDTKIAKAMQKHEDDVNAHINTLQPRIDADHKLPAEFVDGIEQQDVGAAIQEHNEDSDAHSELFDQVQSKLGPSNKLPAAYVDGLASVATTGSYAQLKNLPDTFPPSSHTHVKSEITDLSSSVSWDDVTGKPESFTPSAHTHQSTDVHETITALQAADTEVVLSDGGNYTHTPDSAPIYTLPDVADDTRTHEIVVDVKFSASALSIAFQDTEGTTIPVLDDITPAADDVYRFLVFWSPLQSAWEIMPTKLVRE